MFDSQAGNVAGYTWTVPNSRMWIVKGMTIYNDTVASDGYGAIAAGQGSEGIRTQVSRALAASYPTSCLEGLKGPIILLPGYTISTVDLAFAGVHITTSRIYYEEIVI